MYIVYSLQSEIDTLKFYIGITKDFNRRLIEHNNGQCKTTVKNGPWKLAFFIAVVDRQTALSLEKYLKTGSGRAFAKKHF